MDGERTGERAEAHFRNSSWLLVHCSHQAKGTELSAAGAVKLETVRASNVQMRVTRDTFSQ